MTVILTYHDHPLSYWYAEYVDKVRADDREPLPLTAWANDPSHSPAFRAAFGVTVPTEQRLVPGALLRDKGGKVRYVYVRAGCATSMADCKYGEHAVTVQPLTIKGDPCPGGNICLNARTLSPWSNQGTDSAGREHIWETT